MEKAIHTVIVYQSEVEMIIRHAGKMMKTNSPSIDSVHSKEGIANYVTDYDVQIQEYLIRELNHLFPDCSYQRQ